MSPNLIETKEVAEILHCHPKTVERMARLGLIKAYRPGRKYLFDPESIKEHIMTSEVKK